MYLTTTWASYYNYDNPIVFCLNDSRWVSDNLWKITIPANRNWASVRVNQYSDGSTAITASFWDIALIPEQLFTPPLKYSDKNYRHANGGGKDSRNLAHRKAVTYEL